MLATPTYSANVGRSCSPSALVDQGSTNREQTNNSQHGCGSTTRDGTSDLSSQLLGYILSVLSQIHGQTHGLMHCAIGVRLRNLSLILSQKGQYSSHVLCTMDILRCDTKSL